MKNKTLFAIFLATVLAIPTGLLIKPSSEFLGVTWVSLFDLIGKLFLNALKLVVFPLIISSLIVGAYKLSSGKSSNFKKTTLKLFSYFLLTSALAVLIGFAFVTILKPGYSGNLQQTMTPSSTLAIEKAKEKAPQSTFEVITYLLSLIVPSNLFEAIASGNFLGVIPFCLLFGFYLSKLSLTKQQMMISFFEGTLQTMIQITHLIIKAMPLGVFCLITKSVIETGAETLMKIVSFFIITTLALITYTFFLLPLLLKILSNVNPLVFFKKLAPALFTAFSTSSTQASLPITMECFEKENLSDAEQTHHFALPLAASLNLSATALYSCCAVFFIAQVTQTPLVLPQLLLILLVSLFSSFGMTAGIPSGSLVNIVMILQVAHIPLDGIGLIMPTERFLDMMRTTANVFGNSCCCSFLIHSNKD